MSDENDAPLRTERELLWRFSPVSQRAWLNDLLRIEQQVQWSLRPQLEHSVAHTRLSWWQDELQRLASREPRHPLTRSLAQHAATRGDAPPNLSALVEGCQIDLACLAFETRADLNSYLHGWAESLFHAATGQSDAWGAALRELELLQDFAVHAWQGRIYWPLGDDPTAADPWRARPLAAHEADALGERLRELAAQLRDHCRARPFEPTDDSVTLARVWSALVLLRSERALTALPHGHSDTRLSPLTLTLRLWWAAVQLQQGRRPLIL